MKIVNNRFGLDFLIDNTKPKELVIESPKVFTNIVEELNRQVNGISGSFIISEADKLYDVDKIMELIVNPFSIDFNNKKFIKRIYADLSEAAFNEQLMMFRNASAVMQSFIVGLCDKYHIPLSYDKDVKALDLLKLYNVKVDDQEGNLLERLTYYVQLSSRLIGTKVFVFINLRSYLEEKEILRLHDTAKYEQVALLLIEPRCYETHVAIPTVIVDKDRCVINIEQPEKALTLFQGEGFGEDLIL